MASKLPSPPQLGINVWAMDNENKLVNGFVSGFMGNPNDNDGRYSIQITFFNSPQQYKYYSIREKGKLWNEL
jgi:hypothetical protein